MLCTVRTVCCVLLELCLCTVRTVCCIHVQLEELEQERESLVASIEASVKEKSQQDLRLLEDQLHDKQRVCVIHEKP